ncbi:Uncharacterised protein [Mycobacterium tuberculosis]|nr:Uncharacterised protein [Mycobacterium tuberculosis]
MSRPSRSAVTAAVPSCPVTRITGVATVLLIDNSFHYCDVDGTVPPSCCRK